MQPESAALAISITLLLGASRLVLHILEGWKRDDFFFWMI